MATLDEKTIQKVYILECFCFVYSCMKLALVHDMAECIVGDITPYCGISKEEKHAKEKVGT